MLTGRRPWREELQIIDDTMRAISSVSDPEELVEIYWNGIGKLITVGHYVSLSRREETPPNYVITRSSRFTEHFNPWTEREKLPRLSGGLLGEIIYGNKPVIIDDLPARLLPDDPGYFYLEGFSSAVALPTYDEGEGLNATVMLLTPDLQLDPSVIPILHWQSGLFGRGTQNQVLKNKLADALKSLDKELQVVGQIQRSLLPKKLPTIPKFDLAAYYQTSARAGGDYYDFFPLANDCWGIFIADVSGHGTPAAVLMAITHALAHAQPGTHTPPRDLLQYLNESLTRSYTRNGTFVTAFYAVLDPGKCTLTYSSAGHNPPRLVHGEQVLSLDENAAMPLGIVIPQTYEQATVHLEPRDMLLLYTDGITESVSSPSPTGGPRELFGVERLDPLLRASSLCTARECVTRILKGIATFTGEAPATDDRTLIAMRCI